jgi:hypothetical protein
VAFRLILVFAVVIDNELISQSFFYHQALTFWVSGHPKAIVADLLHFVEIMESSAHEYGIWCYSE